MILSDYYNRLERDFVQKTQMQAITDAARRISSNFADPDIAVNPGLGGIAAAKAAVNTIAGTMSLTTPRVVFVNEDGYQEPVPEHPINALFETGVGYDADMRQKMSLYQYARSGNGYQAIEFGLDNTPIALHPVEICTPQWRENNIIYAAKRFGANRTTREFPESRMIAVHNPNGFNGLCSPSPISYSGRNMINSMIKATTAQDKAFSGTFFRRWLKVNEKAMEVFADDTKQLMDLRNKIENEMQGAQNAGKTPVLGAYTDVIDSDFSATDLQLVEFLNFGILEVSRIFNVPPWALYFYQEGFRSPATPSDRFYDLATYCIQEHMDAWAAQYTAKLLTPQERTVENLRIDYSFDNVMIGTFKERAEIAERLSTRGGLMGIKEARVFLKLPRDVAEDDMLPTPKGSPPMIMPDQSGNQNNES